jgi:F-type H+-transporting ATPase subunit b
VLTAVVTRGPQIDVKLVAADSDEEHAESDVDCEFELEEGETNGDYPCAAGPSPLAIEMKELAWGAGAFIVLALVMRFWLVPAVKKGMDARYSLIREGHEQADTARAAARAEVSEYESALATVKAEANERVEAARHTLEAERTARLEEVNAAIAAKREQAMAEAVAARQAAEADVAAAAVDVASRTVELATGRAPDAQDVRSAVDAAMGAGVSS